MYQGKYMLAFQIIEPAASKIALHPTSSVSFEQIHLLNQIQLTNGFGNGPGHAATAGDSDYCGTDLFAAARINRAACTARHLRAKKRPISDQNAVGYGFVDSSGP